MTNRHPGGQCVRLMIKSGTEPSGRNGMSLLDQATDNSFLAVTTGKFIADGRFAIFGRILTLIPFVFGDEY
jgi:hypothetical protein